MAIQTGKGSRLPGFICLICVPSKKAWFWSQGHDPQERTADDGTSGIFTPAAYEEKLHSLQPIYGLTSGLSNKTIVELLHEAWKTDISIRNIFPRSTGNVPSGRLQFCCCHSFSEKHAAPDRGRRRLVFDEFLLFILAMRLLKEQTETQSQHVSHERCMDHRGDHRQSALSLDTSTAAGVAGN